MTEKLARRFEDLPDVLTVAELKDYLRVGINKAYKLGDEIPHIMAGNRRLFPKERVREWMLKQTESKALRKLRAI